jgi:hypothetical protein
VYSNDDDDDDDDDCGGGTIPIQMIELSSLGVNSYSTLCLIHVPE